MLKMVLSCLLGTLALKHPLPGQTHSPEAADSAGISIFEQLQGVESMEEIETSPTGYPASQGEGEDRRPGKPGDRWDLDIRTRWSGRLTVARGYRTGDYAGSRLKIYNRIRLRRKGSFAAGIVTEKDPGEADPFDFFSFTIAADNLFSTFGVIFGDFRVTAGQGLVFGSARRFGKGTSALAGVLRSPARITPSFSSDETESFRGAAVSATLGPVMLATVVSDRRLSITGGTGVPDRSGYHRTVDELRRRGLARETLWGGIVRFDHRGVVRCGMNFYSSVFSTPIMASSTAGRAGRSFRRGSVDITVRGGPVVFSGEGEWLSGSPSGIAALQVAPHRSIGLVLLFRRYSPRAGFLHGRGFGEAPTAGNESGTYAGVEADFFAGLKFAAYLDVFHSLVPARGVVYPEMRIDRLIFLALPVGKSLNFSLKYQMKDGEEKSSSRRAGNHSPVPVNASLRSEKWRLDGVLLLNRKTRCRFRLDHILFRADATGIRENGTALSASFDSESLDDVRVEAGFTLFDTDSYDTRIYRMERGLPGSLSGTVLSGKGRRWYVVVAYNPSGLLKISLKYSFLQRHDRRRLGTGLEELPTNVDEKGGMQIDIRL